MSLFHSCPNIVNYYLFQEITYSNQILSPVNNALARNCTDISPCQLDSTIIRDEEIRQNIVNGCGRTELNGNIDIGEQTENELAANRVTSVKKGSVLSVTIHQVSIDLPRFAGRSL